MRRKRSERNKTSKKVKNISINFLLLILANLIIGCTFSIPMVYYGPFKNTKEYVVTTAMTTLSHQYLATWFLSDKEIAEIMDKNKIVNDTNSEVEDIKVEPVVETIEKVKTPEELVKFTDISNDKFKGYMLTITDGKRVKVSVSDKIGSSGTKLADMIKQEEAIAGINAGGFKDEGGHGSGGTPLGLIIHDGKVVFGNEKVEHSVIGFNKEGVLVLGKYTLSQIREKNITEAVSFEPFLIVNGEPMIKSGNGGWGIAPRTIIGQKKNGDVVFLAIDGRQISSKGATLKEVQDLLLEYDVYNAANLDGGASTTMYYKDKIVNKPCSSGGPRPLPTAFIVK